MKTEAWHFFTNHALVLFSIAQNPSQSLREVALHVGITERAVQKIVRDLDRAGYLVRSRSGRHNTYELHPEVHLRHPIGAHCSFGDLLGVILPKGNGPSSPENIPAPPR